MNSLNHLERFRAKVAGGEVCLGTGITFSDPAVAELAGEVGYDFVWIDMEHGPFDLQTALGHVMAVRGTGAAPFVRVRCNDANVIKPVLDLAPAGLIVPNILTAQGAAEAVRACRYPPQGTRGYGPRRGQRFGAASQPEYLDAVRDEPLIILQIEHADAVERLDEILAVPGIDSICVGPNDLSGSFGKFGQWQDPQVADAIETIASKTNAAGPMLGVSTFYTEENFARWLDLGVSWINLSVDFANLRKASAEVLAAAHGIAGRR